MTAKPSYPELQDLFERRNKELATMMDIAKTLTSSLDLEEILQVIMNKVSIVLKPQMWSLLLIDKVSDELYFKIAVSPVSEQLMQIRLKRGEGIAGWVAANGEPLLIADAQKDQRFARHIDWKVSFTTKSIICVPMKIKDRVIGVIELINSFEDSNYDESDLALLSAIADYAAIAIDNAQSYERIRELVITDELTGLYNAGHFNLILDRELANAQRYHFSLSLVFFDLDHFKSVNDTYGHLVGSRILSEVGELVKRNIRASDYGARFGGDEYVILLTNTHRDNAFKMVSNLRNLLISHPFRSDAGDPIAITASFGIAGFPDDATTKIDFMKRADEAMYEVKAKSRDGIMGSQGT